MSYLYLLIAGIVGFVLGRQTLARRRQVSDMEKPNFSEMSKDEFQKVRNEATKALSKRTEDRKEKILELMRSEREHRKELKTCGMDETSAQVTCKDVMGLLDVSSNTALKYLNELEAEKKIEQVGEKGVGVYYALANTTKTG